MSNDKNNEINTSFIHVISPQPTQRTSKKSMREIEQLILICPPRAVLNLKIQNDCSN